MALDALGLNLDDGNPLSRRPSVLLYAPAGVGKSTQMAMCFQHGLFIQSTPTVLRPFASWLEMPEGKATGLQMPARKTIRSTEQLKAMGTTTRQALETVINAVLAAKAAGTCPYDAIVIDEYTTFTAQIHEETTRKHEKIERKRWGNPVADEVEVFHRWLTMIPAASGLALGLVCHETPPVYNDAEGESANKLAAPLRGALKARGGPALRPARAIAQVCAATDIVIQMTIEAGTSGLGAGMNGTPARRQFCTEVHPLWERKFRDMRIGREYDLSKTSLRDLLLSAGYSL